MSTSCLSSVCPGHGALRFAVKQQPFAVEHKRSRLRDWWAQEAGGWLVARQLLVVGMPRRGRDGHAKDAIAGFRARQDRQLSLAVLAGGCFGGAEG